MTTPSPEAAVTSSPAGVSQEFTSEQPRAERDATLACVAVALMAPAGVAGGFFGQSLVRDTVTVSEALLAVALFAGAAPPGLLAILAGVLGRRASKASTLPLQRARLAVRLATPFALVGAVTGFLVALGAVFADAFLFNN